MTVIIVIVLSNIFPLKEIYESVPYLYDYVLLFVCAMILAQVKKCQTKRVQ